MEAFLGVLRQYWWLLLVVALLVFVSTNYQRNMRYIEREKKKNAERSAKLQVGASVILDSGMHGVVREIGESTYTIEIAPKTLVVFEKYGVIFADSGRQARKTEGPPGP